jgi:hypothetical protein
MTALEGVADFMGYNSEIPKLRRERKAVLPCYRLIGRALLSLFVNPKAMVYFFFL